MKLPWGLFKTRFVLIDFSSGIEDIPWAEPETWLVEGLAEQFF